MKSKLFLSLLIVMFAASLIGAYLVLAEDTKKDDKKKCDVVCSCPVTGEKIDKDKAVGPYKYKGKEYYFCCEDCLKKFKENPDKYSHHHHHHRCVCLNTEKKTDYKAEYEGKTYYFCSEKCKASFEKNPAGYMAKMKKVKDDGIIDHDEHEGCAATCSKKCSAVSKCHSKKEEKK